MAGKGAGRLVKVAIALGCLGYAALALGSGFDRAAMARPELAPLVPSPLASHALRSEGAALIARGDARTALKRGEAAVADAPLDPGSTALLGMARFRQGDAAGADRAFRIAGQLGWRDGFTQTYWMGRALEIGDWRIAAMRLDALLRQRPALVAERRLMDPFENSAAGRAAMAERLLAAPNWLETYTLALDGVPRQALQLRAAVLGEVGTRKGVLGCEAVAPLADRLASNAAEVQAITLWRQHCPSAAGALVYDGRFAAATLNQYRSRFAWVFAGHADTNIALEPVAKDGAQQLVAETTSARPRLIAQQMILIPPGAYRLSWKAQDAEGRPSDLVKAMLSCSRGSGEWLPAQLDPASGRWSAAVGVGSDCKAQWLNFAAGGRAGTVRLGDILLEPAR